jgi:hypothetical protein
MPSLFSPLIQADPVLYPLSRYFSGLPGESLETYICQSRNKSAFPEAGPVTLLVINVQGCGMYIYTCPSRIRRRASR